MNKEQLFGFLRGIGAIYCLLASLLAVAVCFAKNFWIGMVAFIAFVIIYARVLE